jgi:hypothetical protein
LPKKKRSFKEILLAMPNVGEERDFKRGPQIERLPRLTKDGFSSNPNVKIWPQQPCGAYSFFLAYQM